MKAFVQRSLLLAVATLSGCGGAAASGAPGLPSTSAAPTATPSATATPGSTSTSLPLGDGKYANAPGIGTVYLCSGMVMPGGPATSTSLPWLNGDGTYDPSKKPAVQGSVSWPSQLSITVNGTTRTIIGNGLPSHTTGTFPIASSDPAYQYGPNPNAISAQTISLALPTNPVVAQAPSCVGMGAVGVMLTGAVFFNAFDAQGNDANAHEVQDACAGHPQQSGMYHYHRLSPCSADSVSGHSALVGYALDGFGMYGPRGENGAPLTNADLDECHGHTHAITWDGKTVTMYHYHATDEFPYTIGCYRGTPVAPPR